MDINKTIDKYLNEGKKDTTYEVWRKDNPSLPEIGTTINVVGREWEIMGSHSFKAPNYRGHVSLKDPKTGKSHTIALDKLLKQIK